MELESLKPSERQIEIYDPAEPEQKKPIGIRISLMHVSDERLKKLKREIQNEKLRLEQRGKYFKAEELEENMNRAFFTAMTGWEWYNPTGMPGDEGYNENAHMTWKGNKNPPLDKATVFAIFDKYPWFLEQIVDAMGDTKAFFSR